MLWFNWSRHELLEVHGNKQNFLTLGTEYYQGYTLTLFNRVDCFLWPRNRDGVYSVESGYPSPSSSEVNQRVWKCIWSLWVPNQVKSLLWQVGTDSPPNLVNLIRCKVLNDGMCLSCKLQQEDFLYALWSCLVLTEVWSVQFDHLRRAKDHSSSFLDVIQLAFMDKSNIDVFAMMVSVIWMRRNKVRLGEETFPLVKINSLLGIQSKNFKSSGLHMLWSPGQPV